MKVFLLLGSLSAAMSVALGAFGAHGLRARVAADLLTTFETGARYQMYHALALLFTGVIGLWLSQSPPGALQRLLVPAGWLFLAGTVFFSGSLYLLALTGLRWLGAVTPVGGVCFIAGWLCLAVAVWQGFR